MSNIFEHNVCFIFKKWCSFCHEDKNDSKGLTKSITHWQPGFCCSTNPVSPPNPSRLSQVTWAGTGLMGSQPCVLSRARPNDMSTEQKELTQTPLHKIWVPGMGSSLGQRRGCKCGDHLIHLTSLLLYLLIPSPLKLLVH